MRFDDETLAYANAVRGLLPERLLARPGRRPERRLDRAWFEARIARDPSEAADSGRTLAAIAELFADPVVRPTGGVVYFVALNGLFANFDMAAPEDRALLQHLLTLDEIHTVAHPGAHDLRGGRRRYPLRSADSRARTARYTDFAGPGFDFAGARFVFLVISETISLSGPTAGSNSGRSRRCRHSLISRTV